MARINWYKRLECWRITVTVQSKDYDVYLPKGTSKKDAVQFHEKAGKLERARNMATEVEPGVAEWVQLLSPKMRGKLARARLIDKPVEQAAADVARLGPFVDAWIASQKKRKPNTVRNYKQTRRLLVAYFGETKPLESITPGDADGYREYLMGEGFAVATIAREVKRARQVFKAAVRKGLISANAFADVKGGKQENASRFYFVSMEDYQAVIDACPNLEWRLLVALGRIGGLRLPSEAVGLRWVDVDWERERFRVHSPKLESHPDKANRWVPLFPPLRELLSEAWAAASDGAEYVLPTMRDASKNMRTQFSRIIRRAGRVPWERLFQNLRASRATELASEYPSFVAAAWLGHTEQVADAHYRHVLERHFEQAAGGTAKSTALVPQKVPQQESAGSCTESQETQKAPVSQGFVLLDATQHDSEQMSIIPPRGVEPLFSD